jgi:2-iminobutanoate/2-iminopropanoate deaminase
VRSHALPLAFSGLLFATTMMSACTMAPQTSAPERCYHLNAPIETEIGYCQAIRVGKRLYISGSVGKGEMPAAIRGAYGELQATLKAQGLTFQNVVKETVYTTNLDEFIHNKDVRKEFYGDAYPAASWVQVQRLYTPAFVVEVELEALFP